MTTPDLTYRAQHFVEMAGTSIEKQLGFGSDGTVWQTGRKTAIKVFERREVYLHELAVYERLLQRRIRRIGSYSIPVLIRHDDVLMVIEMTLVDEPNGT